MMKKLYCGNASILRSRVMRFAIEAQGSAQEHDLFRVFLRKQSWFNNTATSRFARRFAFSSSFPDNMERQKYVDYIRHTAPMSSVMQDLDDFEVAWLLWKGNS